MHQIWAARRAWRQRLLRAGGLALLSLPLVLWSHPAWVLLSLLGLVYPSSREEGRALAELDRRYGLAYRSALEAPAGHPWHAQLEAEAQASLKEAKPPGFPWVFLLVYGLLLGAAWLLPGVRWSWGAQPVGTTSQTAPAHPSTAPHPPASPSRVSPLNPAEPQPPSPSSAPPDAGRASRPAGGEQGDGARPTPAAAGQEPPNRSSPGSAPGQDSAQPNPTQPGSSQNSAPPSPSGSSQNAAPAPTGSPSSPSSPGSQASGNPQPDSRPMGGPEGQGSVPSDRGAAGNRSVGDGQRGRGIPEGGRPAPSGANGGDAGTPRPAPAGSSRSPDGGDAGAPANPTPIPPAPAGASRAGEAPLGRAPGQNGTPQQLPSPWPAGSPPQKVQRQAQNYLENEPLPPEVRDLLRRYFELSQQ
ncbi:hypothetical protein [Meiothermus granaticius]|uniref:Uncharacterized protein n=1 Tax=Meiothermus granaticius NBRC 107808 TaxID=1227551 RepID=A0A399FCA4_9DEIN|nr:hypothetical protein [Meiothermus granaticius]RIH93850.1 hypothetical protein Mgrana_00199 [Meiothermus granaticius NBRC 107808]